MPMHEAMAVQVAKRANHLPHRAQNEAFVQALRLLTESIGQCPERRRI